MNYLDQKIKIIYEIKKSIINEFRYNTTDIGFLANLIEPDVSITINSLKEAFRIEMSHQEKQILRKYKIRDLFNQALAELFSEQLINFVDNRRVVMTEKGENMFIVPDRWYK
ncbi:MAG: hypothetical protein U9M90_00530 [Patescibacteria group bacterium]|nr:hypothetical protein [Patescibacteria group bacterium]